MPESTLEAATGKLQQSWTVGVLCFNEAGSVDKVVRHVVRVIQQLTDTYEIILVDDGSTDGSADIVKSLAAAFPAIVPVAHGTNLGIGAGLREVYTRARFENIVNVPADGQFDLAEILDFPTVPAGRFVCFYRKENTIYNPFRNALSFLNKKTNQILLGITVKDVNWAKIYKRADVSLLDLQLQSSLVESEIIAKLLHLGRRPIEAESNYLPRTSGVSKGASWNIVRQALRDLVTLNRIMRKFRRKNSR